MNPTQQTKLRSALIPALLLTLLALRLVTSASAQSSLTNGLVAYWSFDAGAAADDSGNGHNGTLFNTVATNGNRGGALGFNGVNSRVQVIPDTALNLRGAVSITAWIRPSSNFVDVSQTILRNGLFNDELYALYYAVGGNVSFVWYDTDWRVLNSSPGLIAPEQWTHVAATRSATHFIRLYVNGVEVGSGQGAQPTATNPQYLQIGSTQPDPSYDFSGLIDEVRIYNRVLTTNEIQVLMNPISITNQPQNNYVLAGGTASFVVGANGALPLFYQWRLNGTNLANQTNATLLISNITIANVGTYSVVVSNEFGTLTSASAYLTIATPGYDDDGDGLANALEAQYGTNPLNPDTDGDGIFDYDELFAHLTNPLLSDTDGDGMPDGWEIQHGLNPRVNDASDDLDGDGISNLAEYSWGTTHTTQLDPRKKFSTNGTLSDFAVVTGVATNQFFYDRNNRLTGAEFDRGLALAYVYDGNDNLVRQVSMRHDANTNGLPDLWEFLNGLTNNTSPYADSDGDGWTDYQEWKAESNPCDAQSTPNLLGNPGTNIASITLPFTPSNFVVGVGQLDGLGAEEIVLGADGNPGTSINFLLVLTQGATTWSTQRVDVGSFGITSIAVGQVTNRPSAGIYVGLRGTTNGSGRVMEFTKIGGIWQSNLVAQSSNATAFVLAVRASNEVIIQSGQTASPESSAISLNWGVTNWTTRQLDPGTSILNWGTIVGASTTNPTGLRLLNNSLLQLGFENAPIPETAINRPEIGKIYFATPTAMTWSNAQDYARTFQGNLATISNNTDNSWLRSSFSGDFWIGLWREDCGANWKWASGAPFSFSAWAGGEPNCLNGAERFGLMWGAGTWNDGRFDAALPGIVEVSTNYLVPLKPILKIDYSARNRLVWRGNVLSDGKVGSDGTGAYSFFHAWIEDKNLNGNSDLGDEFRIARFLVVGTNAAAVSENLYQLNGDTLVSSYGITCANYLNSTNKLLFTGEPDGAVVVWTITETNTMQRQLFSKDHVGAGWHSLAAVKTLEPGEGLIGLRVDPTNQNRCAVILWSPQSALPQTASIAQTAPAAAALPQTNVLGSLATVTVRLWDAEGNASTPYLQYQFSGSTNWQNATLVTLDSGAYSTSTRVSTSPAGVNHTVVWNAQANVGANVVTNILLRARASDMTLLGDWSAGTPFQLNTALADNDGMDDSWELLYFGNTDKDGSDDSDGDGALDLAEYIADTNPTNAASYLHFTGVSPVSGGIKLDWLGGSNATQYLQRAIFLNAGGGWSNLITNLPPTPITGSFTDLLDTNVIKFYRIEVTR